MGTELQGNVALLATVVVLQNFVDQGQGTVHSTRAAMADEQEEASSRSFGAP